LAKSQDEWPSTWDDSASFGTAANGKSWIQCMDYVSRTRSAAAKRRNSITSSLSTSFSPTVDISTTSSKRNTSTTSLEPLYIQYTSSSAFQIEDSIAVKLPPHSSFQQKDPPRIPNTPNHAYDNELVLLSEKLGLPEVVVLAAKRIILRLEAEPHFIKQYPKSAKNFSSITLRAALFAACRQLGIPKTFKQIELDLPQHRKPYFHKIFKFIDSILKKDALTSPVQDVDSDSPTNAFPSSFSTRDFILSQVKTMGLSDAVRDRAISISECDKIENVFSGKRANIAAAVILSFAAECEERYLGSAPYAEAANVGTSTIASSQKALLRAVKDMSTRGELPPPFRARWNYPNYKAE
jgi:transcription initiation factor TFIIIB Brf1 subunit/transcription initiation factor TFIIB